ncbi:hypothetical protein [Cellulomonas sp. PS-H5]|uniref:hypothetical protein n=1 Tax=Cellulomonas sp. PS-H5 TaxID=2820400 RepID=UPI001C4FE1EF|nr:hypothetical protein [Cellulomonas sp. PS-H5]MBW0252593.1 hypothetical protein [Cellulomonas sp. PS-H5]
MTCLEYMSLGPVEQMNTVASVAGQPEVDQVQANAVAGVCRRGEADTLATAVPTGLDELARFHQLAPSLTRESRSTTREVDGYSQTLTLELGPVIPGDEVSLTSLSWADVGGTGEFPCQDFENVDIGHITAETAGYAFGTVTVTNDTPDFPAREEIYQFSRAGTAIGYGFSDGAVCRSAAGGGDFLKPNWSDETWGPVPVVVAIEGYRSPDHPEGDAELLTRPFGIFLSDLALPLRAWNQD